MTTNRQSEQLANAKWVLDQFESVTVDDLVQPYRDWIDSVHHRVSEFGYLDEILDALESPTLRARGVALAAKFSRAADIIVGYTIASFISPVEARSAATAARALFEAMTDSPNLIRAMLTDREMLGGADEVAA